MILEAKSISKSFTQGEREIRVIKNLSLSIQRQKSLAIVGPSGSGKSTLLSLLAGLEKPNHGEIIYSNKKLAHFSDQEMTLWRRSEVSMVFQQFHLFPHLTALENTMLPLELVADPEAKDKAEHVLERVGLKDRIHHLPRKISGGEAQRVAIARAIIHKPKLIFADEPSGNLDVNTGDKVMKLFFELVKENQTALVLVTHNLDLAKECDDLLDLSNNVKETQ